jgi:hypothetical protein
MPNKALFAGLIVDEFGNPVETTNVGDESMYIVNDRGFRRHIPSEQVDHQVLKMMSEQIKGNEDILGEQTAKMLGQDDIFSRAFIMNQLKHIDEQMEHIFQTGIPEEGRAYMGMMGFKIVINVHGEVIELNQPGGIADDEGEGGED